MCTASIYRLLKQCSMITLGFLSLPAAILTTAAGGEQQVVADEGPDGYTSVGAEEFCKEGGLGSCRPGHPDCPGNGTPWTGSDSATPANVLKVECAAADCDANLSAYKIWLNDTFVGECPYKGGINWLGYKKDANGVFTSIKHRSHDDGCAVSAPDDNCNDRWDWVVNVYVVGGVRDPHWRQVECADNDLKDHWETHGEDSGEDCGEDCP